jgi:hypothetical protein
VRLPGRHPHRPGEGDVPPTTAEQGAQAPGDPTVVAIDADQLHQLSAVFSAPRWLRDLGIASWLLVGLAALLVGLV